MKNVIIDELATSAAAIPDASLQQIMEKLKTASRIFVYGTGRSGLMLKAFAMRLMQLGRTAFVVGETTTPSIVPGNLLILASASGTTGSVCLMAEEAKKQGVEMIVITANPESRLAKLHPADLVISSGTKFSSSSASIQPLGSLFEQMLLVVFDQIIFCLSQENQSEAEDMARRHASLE